MKKRDRSWRIGQTNRTQDRRKKKWLSTGSSPDWVCSDLTLGKFKKTNFSCGCTACKPWKHGKDFELPASQRRKYKR